MRVGSSAVELKLAGPVHEYEVPPEPVAFRLMVFPTQYGPVFEAETVGLAFTVIYPTLVSVSEPEPLVAVRLT